MSRTTFIVSYLALLAFAKVPFYFTLDLGTFTEQGRLRDQSATAYALSQAKNLNAAGVVSDLWWSTVEKAPRSYDFAGYLDLAKAVKEAGLELQFILSFHGCAENDPQCSFTLPAWILATDKDIFPKSDNGRVSKEYISPFADNEVVLDGRTPLQAYDQFIAAFVSAFWDYLGSTITEVQIGLGPSGQLRFPSYVNFKFCGVGQFMEGDSFAKDKLRKSLSQKNIKIEDLELGNDSFATPARAPFFQTIAENSCAVMSEFKEDCGFEGITEGQCTNKGCCWAPVQGDKHCYFKRVNVAPGLTRERTIDGDAGKTFSIEYSKELIAHADRVLTLARDHLFFIRLGIKISAVHWSAGSVNRAPEATTGYFVSDQYNFYAELMDLLAKHKVMLTISGIEMSNNPSKDACYSRAKDLVDELKTLAKEKKVELMGENAWERSDPYALDTMADNAEGLTAINYLRLSEIGNKNENDARALFGIFLEKLEVTNSASYYEVVSQALTNVPEFDCDECRELNGKNIKLIF